MKKGIITALVSILLLNFPSNLQASSYTQNGETTAPGMEDTKQRAAEFSTAGFGPATLRNIESRDLAYSFFFGRIWEVNPFAGIRVIADATTDFRNSALTSLSMGLNLTPFEAEVMPYGLAEFGLGFGRESNRNLFGFNAAAGAGLMLFRSATAQMIIEGKAGFLFDDIANGFPALFTARLGIHF